MEITINGKAYNVRYTLRAMMMWEAITKKRFEIVTITDQWLYYFTLLLASNPGMEMDFEEFVDACDDEPAILVTMGEFINAEAKKRELFSGDDADEAGEEKKSGR